METYFAFGEYTHTLRLTSELVDLRAGYAKWIRRAKLAEPRLIKLHKHDARCCIILMERYRSGPLPRSEATNATSEASITGLTAPN